MVAAHGSSRLVEACALAADRGRNGAVAAAGGEAARAAGPRPRRPRGGSRGRARRAPRVGGGPSSTSSRAGPFTGWARPFEGSGQAAAPGGGPGPASAEEPKPTDTVEQVLDRTCRADRRARGRAEDQSARDDRHRHPPRPAGVPVTVEEKLPNLVSPGHPAAAAAAELGRIKSSGGAAAAGAVCRASRRSRPRAAPISAPLNMMQRYPISRPTATPRSRI